MTRFENKDWPTFKDLLGAYKECRIGKPASTHQTRFEFKLGDNLLALRHEIQTQKYKPSRSLCFIVTHPKPREIFAAHFRDRIVHHLIVSRLTPKWERKFSPFSFACRKDRGTHGALKELQKQVRCISHGGRKTVYVLQLDISSFFVSIRRDLLCDLLIRHTKDERLRWLIKTSIGHDARTNFYMKSPSEMQQLIPLGKSWLTKATNEGLPIGNLTSQFGANVYLNDLDHWIVRNIKPMGYLRYMDDLTLLHTDPKFLEPLASPINEWLQTHRSQELNTSKTMLKSLREGIDYLGYRIVQVDGISEPARLLSPAGKKWELVKDVRNLEKTGIPNATLIHPLSAQVSYRKARDRMASVNSRLALLHHSKSYHFRKKVVDRLTKSTAIENVTLTASGVEEHTWKRISVKRNYKAIKVR